jgi:TP901 family phage tail tape measure protein
MAQRIAYLEAVVGADITSFRRGMQDVRRETGMLSDTMGGLSHLGRNMTLAVTTPIIAAGTAMVKSAADFDASMRNINSIAFLTEDQLKALNDRTLEFGSSIRSGPQAAAESLYTVFSAGITDVDAAFMVMQIGAKTAEAGLADLTTTTEGLTAAALTFGDQSESALQRFSDAATLAVQLGVGSMDTYNTGMANVIGTGAALGDTYEDLAATTAYLSQRGIDFASAGTYLNNALTKMLKPGEELDALFHQMGVKSGKELINTTGGFTQALRAMYDVVGGDETVWAKLFPDARGFKAVSRIFTMFEKDGTDAVSTFFDNFDQKMQAGGVTAAAWEQQMMSFSAQWEMMLSAVQGLGITIGQILLPILTPVIQGLHDFFLQLQQASPEALKLGVAIAAVVAAIGPILWIFGSLVTFPGIIIGAIAGLALAFASNFGGIRDTVTATLTKIIGDLEPFRVAFQTFIDTLFPKTATPTPSSLIGPVEPMQTYASAAGAAIGGSLTTAITTATSAWDLYTSTGLDKKMSWTSFQDELKKQGWTGGALTEGMTFSFFDVPAMTAQIGTEIGQITNPQQDQFNKGLAYLNNMEAPQDNSLGGRLSAAITAAWPKLQIALEGLWTSAKEWFEGTAIPDMDTWGGDALNSIARWFLPTGSTGEGNGPVYDALESLLSGDIGKAASNVGTWFDEHFPKVSAGLSTFIGNIGTWMSNEGVPTIARSVGYMVGKLAVLLSAGISGIWDLLNQKTSASDMGKGMTNVGSQLGDKLFTPLGEGYQDAIKDAKIGNPIDEMFTALSGALVVGAGAFVVAPKLGAIIVAKIWAALTASAATSTATAAAGTSMFSSIATAIATAASVAAPIALVLAGVAATVTAFALIVDENARTQAHKAITGIIDGIFGEGITKQITDKFTIGMYAALSGLAQTAGDVMGITGGDPAIRQMWYDKAKQWGDWAKEGAEAVVIKPTTMTFDWSTVQDVKQIGAPTAPPLGAGQQVNPFDTSGWNLSTNVGPGIVQSMIDGVNATPITPEQFTEFQTNVGGALNSAVATGNLDGQAIVDSLIVPLATGFYTNFGAESMAAIAWTTFITGVKDGELAITEKFTLISEDITLLSADATKNMPIISAAVIGAMNMITKSIHDADFAAKNLSATLNALNGSTVTISTAVAGAPIPMHASGGTASGMSIVGERGPELVDFSQKGTVFPTRMLRDGMGGGGGGSNVTVFVQGVTTVQDFVYEMKRMGYDVEELKK